MNTPVFQRESINVLRREAAKLFEDHHNEVGPRGISHDVDWSAYNRLEEAGKLVCFTGRDPTSLVAYATFVLSTHLHYSAMEWAFNDFIYVQPKSRGRLGIELIRYAERELKALGAKVITYNVTKHFDWGLLAERLGYKASEVTHMKILGD